MPLTDQRIAELLAAYLGEFPAPATLYSQLNAYLELLLRWNARTNLTAIREAEQIVRRHFGESLFAGLHLATDLKPTSTLLDFGSGAGFPGLPIQILLPDLKVTLAESQGKKASFLREAVRTLGLRTEVWADRVEAMPLDRKFDVVALRAVDKMDVALTEARNRTVPEGLLAILGGIDVREYSPSATTFPIPDTADSFFYLDRC